MIQITIYLDEETAEQMRAFVQSRQISQSKWIADLIREKLDDEWPDHIAELAGAWADSPDAETLRKDLGRDIARKPL